jgi:hypothetical protein
VSETQNRKKKETGDRSETKKSTSKIKKTKNKIKKALCGKIYQQQHSLFVPSKLG